MSAPFATFAQTAATGTAGTVPAPVATVAVDPGLVPGDFFYFLDRWSEALNTAFTFNKEKKAKLHLEYAKERVAEMKEVLKNPNAKLEDVASAKENFDTQVADAAALVKSEKENGADVAGLARELDDELDMSRGELKDIFKEHKDNTSRAEDEIRAKLTGLAPTDPQVQGLTQALESITKEKDNAVKEGDDVDANLQDEQKTFEEVMGKEMAAQKHMEQAMRLRDRMEQGLPADLSASSDKFMKEAQDAMKRGDFDSAVRMSKDAERSIEKAKEMNGASEMRVPAVPGMTEGSVENMGESHVNNLEQEIQKGEKAMDDLGR